VTTEQRLKERVSLRLRCFVTTKKFQQTKLVAETVDVSRSGIRFRLDADTSSWNPFECGDEARVEVELPAEHSLGRRCIHARGRVVRVEPDGIGGSQVALVFHSADFRDLTNSGLNGHIGAISDWRM
jgi:hypothetical protein